VRLYAQVIKLEGAREQGKGATQGSEGRKPKQLTLRGSVICFRQESVEVCSNLLSLENMKKDLQLQFVGPDGGWDWMYHRCYGGDPARLVGEAHKIYSWLRVLSLVNPYYEDMTELPPADEISSRLKALAEELVEDSFRTLDDARLNESMKARDDIARVRNAISSDDDSPPAESAGVEGGEDEDDEGGASSTSMRYVLVTSPDSTANENARDSVHGTLKSAAKMFGVDVNKEARAYNRTAGGDKPVEEEGDCTSDEEEFGGECLTRQHRCVAPSLTPQSPSSAQTTSTETSTWPGARRLPSTSSPTARPRGAPHFRRRSCSVARTTTTRDRSRRGSAGTASFTARSVRQGSGSSSSPSSTSNRGIVTASRST